MQDLCGHGQPLFWCDSALGHIESAVSVFSHPLRYVDLNFVQAFPVIPRQSFIAHQPIKSLDEGVLLQLASLDIFPSGFPASRLVLDFITHVFPTVVSTNQRGLTFRGNNLL